MFNLIIGKEVKIGLEVTREEDFSKWYQQVYNQPAVSIIF
jgi:hypothetical protein